jgi:hypothetical protein
MKWYNYLNPKIDNPNTTNKGLLECETLETNNLVVCQKLKFLYFGKFGNYLDFVKHMLKETTLDKRCFYEIIFGNKAQKIYFDIEFHIDDSLVSPTTSYEDGQLILPTVQADESIKYLVNLIKQEIPPLSTNKGHILVFTSHKENKRSYHIVVEKYGFPDHKSNKMFHDKIVSLMPDSWKHIIDHSMYKSSQQFRIVGSCKFESDRYKTLSEELTVNYTGSNGWIPQIDYETSEEKMMLLVEASLVSNTTSCMILPKIIDPEEEIKNEERKARILENGLVFNPLTPDEIKEVMNLCYQKAGLTYGDPSFPYIYKEIIEDNGESSILLLKRRMPSKCRACNRIHEHENPYLIVVGQDRDIYLDCRRNDFGKKTYVGRLGLRPGTERVEPSGNDTISKRFKMENFLESHIIEENFSIETEEQKTDVLINPVVDVSELTRKLQILSSNLAPKITEKVTKKKEKYNNKFSENIQLNFKF